MRRVLVGFVSLLTLTAQAVSAEPDDIRSKLNGHTFSAVQDDAPLNKIRCKEGTVHHIDGATVTLKDVVVIKAGDVMVITLKVKLSGGYKRIEHHGRGGGGDLTVSEQVMEEIELIFTKVGNKVTPVSDPKIEGGSGHGDGRNVMRRQYVAEVMTRLAK